MATKTPKAKPKKPADKKPANKKPLPLPATLGDLKENPRNPRTIDA